MFELSKSRSLMKLLGLASSLSLCLAISACGFHLAGESPLPFDSLYIGVQENSKFGADMRRAFKATSPKTKIEENTILAEVQLQQIAYSKSLREISLNSLGQVQEYELTLVIVIQLTDKDGQIIMPSEEFLSVRDLPYDPNVIQAKEGQIASVFKDMEQATISRIVRRVTSPEVIDRAERLMATGSTDLSGEPAQVARPIRGPSEQLPDAVQRSQLMPKPDVIQK